MDDAAREEAERRWPRTSQPNKDMTPVNWHDEGMASGFVLGSEWQAEQPVEITNAMIQRLREAIYAQLSGQYGDFTLPTITEAETVLEAALSTNGGTE